MTFEFAGKIVRLDMIRSCYYEDNSVYIERKLERDLVEKYNTPQKTLNRFNMIKRMVITNGS